MGILKKFARWRDPLHEILTPEERQVIYVFHNARDKFRFLKTSLESGEPVEEMLEKAKICPVTNDAKQNFCSVTHDLE